MTACRCPCRAARRRSCSCASRSRPGVVVRTDRLLDDLWGADAVTTSRNTLQSKVAQAAPGARRSARRSPAATAATGSPSSPRRWTRSPCCATAPPRPALLDAGDDRGAAELSAAALARFRGDVLPAAGDGDWVRPAPGAARRGAHAARRDAARARGCALGDAGDVIGELEAAVAAHPFREGLWELLDHGAVPRRAPGRRARRLPARPRAARRRARARSGAAAARARAPGPRRTTRRWTRRRAAGRRTRRRRRETCRRCRPSSSVATAEIAALATCSRAQRLVEIVGPGGIGKTALALATGARG